METNDLITFGAFLVEHAVEITVGLLALSGACSQLAAITPWTWDDRAAGFLGGFVRFAKVLAGNYGHAANEKP